MKGLFEDLGEKSASVATFDVERRGRQWMLDGEIGLEDRHTCLIPRDDW